MSEASKAVFLSYASQDAAAAGRICATLREAGIEIWFDQSELRGGDAWDAMIRRQIKACALFIAVISRNTHARDEGYFRLEWKLGVDRSSLMTANRTFILPVVVDDTPDDDEEVPDKFREVQWTRLPGGETPPAFIARIRQLLAYGPPGGSAAAPIVPATPAAPATPRGRRAHGRLIWIAVIALAAAAAGYALLRQHPVGAPGHDAPTREMPAAPAPASLRAPIPDKSIAVLPFTDMSEKKDQEYFSQGLAEELIDQLSRVSGLHVAARTSSFYFQGKSEDIAAIAQKLRVAHILEGSVRKSGNTLRITAQLIRADNGYHLWSESYDREVKDVFKVQDDIAHAVVEKLRVTLLPSARESSARPISAEAHNLYLQARYVLALDSRENLAKAVELFKRSLALDEQYAPAWAGLSLAFQRQIANGIIVGDDAFTASLAAAQKAITLDPHSGDAYSTMGIVQATAHHDWNAARATLARGLEADPGNVQVIFFQATLAVSTETAQQAIPIYDRALERDPLNLLVRRYRARALYFSGRLEEAEAALREVLSTNPTFPAAAYELGRVLLAKGAVEEAIASFEAEQAPSWRQFGLPLGYFAAHRLDDAAKALAELLRNAAGSEMQVAESYAFFGRKDEAFKWLDAADRNKDPGILWLRGDPLMKSLVSDRRYRAFLAKVGLPDRVE